MIALAAAMLIGQSIGGVHTLGDENLVAGDVGPGFDAFADICLRPFPDERRFAEAVAGNEAHFVRASPTETATRIAPGTIQTAARGVGVWSTTRVNIRYMADGSLDPALPQPQCIVTVRFADPAEQASLPARLATRLRLANGRLVSVGPYSRALWTVAQPDGRAWRIVLTSLTDRQGSYLKMSLLRLNAQP